MQGYTFDEGGMPAIASCARHEHADDDERCSERGGDGQPAEQQHASGGGALKLRHSPQPLSRGWREHVPLWLKKASDSQSSAMPGCRANDGSSYATRRRNATPFAGASLGYSLRSRRRIAPSTWRRMCSRRSRSVSRRAGAGERSPTLRLATSWSRSFRSCSSSVKVTSRLSEPFCQVFESLTRRGNRRERQGKSPASSPQG